MKKTIILLMLVFVFILQGYGFADNENVTSSYKGIIAISQFLSWAWMFFAVIAGKLLSNDFVYGSVFNLDIYLWKLWNLMKNFANFIIGFTFIAVILKSFFSTKDSPASVFKKYIPKIMLAGVLVQASWFLVGAILDISMIMTVAVGSFPQQFMKTDSSMKNLDKIVATIPAECIFDTKPDPKDLGKAFTNCKEGKVDKERSKKIVEFVNDYSGPLLFFGMGVLRLQDQFFLPDNQKDIGNITFGLILWAIINIMFVLPIIFMIILNVIRVFWIWVYVIFSPLIVVDALVFGGKLAGKKEAFKISNAIGLIFQPVAMVGVLGLALILIVGMQGVMSSGTKEDQKMLESKMGVKCDNSNKCTMGDNSIGDFHLEYTPTKTVAKAGGAIMGSFGYLFMTIITIMLLWGVVRAGFKASKITSKVSDSMFNFAKGMAMSAKVVPIGSGLSLGGISKGLHDTKTRISPELFLSKERARIQEEIGSLTGLGDRDLKSTDVFNLKSSTYNVVAPSQIGEVQKFFTALKSSTKGRKITWNSSSGLQDTFKFWLKNQGGLQFFIHNKNTLKIHANLDINKPDESITNLLNDHVFWHFFDSGMKNPSTLTLGPYNTGGDTSALIKTKTYSG